MPPVDPPSPPSVPASTVVISFTLAGDVATFPRAKFEAALHALFPKASRIELTIAAASIQVDATMTFPSVWDASAAIQFASETTAETMQATWFPGLGITLTGKSQPLSSVNPQADVMWHATVPGALRF